MKIVKIAVKREKDVTILFDNDEKLFLSYEIFLKNGLRKNDDISESRFLSIVEENQKYYLKQKAFRYLGRRLHSTYEMKLKLRQKSYKQELIEQIIGELKHDNYLNDYEFALMFTEENIKNKHWGRKKLEAELFRKGVDRGIVSQIVDKKYTPGNEFDNAVETGRKKLKSLLSRNIDKNKLESKLYSFLLTKGYDYEICRRVIESLVRE
jgi:regulatory protein